MINEERVVLMTKLAAYEQKEGKKNIEIANYFRGDYVTVQVIKAIGSATIAFLIVFAVYIFYDFEMFIQDIYKMDLVSFAKNTLFNYIIVVVAYCVLVYIVASIRYARVKKSLRLYYQNLKKLNNMYQE